MGFVKISDDLPSWAWYGDNNTLLVYIRLLLGAVWCDTDYQNVTLQRGQIATTLPKIAKENNISERQARTIIDRLKKAGKVTVKTTSKFSIITIINYDCTLKEVSQNDIQLTGERHTERQSNDSPTLYKTDIQNIRHTDNARAREGDGSPKALKKALETGFERFWSAYPKKTAKQAALKAWTKLRPDEGLTETILSALEWFKQTDQWRKDNGQYIPYPATWLNGKRWEDDLKIEEEKTNGSNITNTRSERDWLRGFNS